MKGPHERDDHALGCLGDPRPRRRCATHSGMQHIGRHGSGRQPPCQLIGEQDVRELGLVVGPGAGIVPLALQVIAVDSPLGVRVDDTVTMRDGALCFSRSRSRFVSRNDADGLPQTCAPVRQQSRAGYSSTPRRCSPEHGHAEHRATRRQPTAAPASADRSPTNTCTPTAVPRGPREPHPRRRRSRPVTTRCAPDRGQAECGRPLPMPAVPPVTKTVLPTIDPSRTRSMLVLQGRRRCPVLSFPTVACCSSSYVRQTSAECDPPGVFVVGPDPSRGRSAAARAGTSRRDTLHRRSKTDVSRHSEVVQRREGLRLHRPGRRRR